MAYWRLYYHIVWGTKARQPYITPDLEDPLFSTIGSLMERKNGKVFAINGMPDHIHVVTAIPPTQLVSEFVQVVKGASSHMVNHELESYLRWQT